MGLGRGHGTAEGKDPDGMDGICPDTGWANRWFRKNDGNEDQEQERKPEEQPSPHERKSFQMRANGAAGSWRGVQKLSGTRTSRIPVDCLYSIPCHKGMIAPGTRDGPFTEYPPDYFENGAIGKRKPEGLFWQHLATCRNKDQSVIPGNLTGQGPGG